MGVKLLGKIKIHEIAKKVGLASKEVIEKARELGIAVTSHLSTIENEQAEKLEQALDDGKTKNIGKKEKKVKEKETDTPVIIRRELIITDEDKKKEKQEEKNSQNRKDVGFVEREKNQNYNIVYRNKPTKPLTVNELFGIKDSKKEEQKKEEVKEQSKEQAKEQAKEEKQQQVKGGGAGGVVAAPAIETQTDSRTTKQLVDDMYKRLTENGKIDAETRKRILSGMGYSDLIDMASKMSMWKRHNVNKLLDATLKDLGRLDNAKALKLDELLFDKFGVADAYSALAEGDFSKLSEEQLSDIKKIIDTFNDNPDNYTREEQILIDEFAKRVSLKSLSYQMKRAGVFGRVAECFTPGRQSRRDVHASFNTFVKNKSNRVKNVANSDFALEMKANVRTDDEISMSPSSSLQDKQRQYSRGERS